MKSLKQISSYVVTKQIEKGFLPDGDKEIYVYGYEVMLNQMIVLFFSVLIAIVFSAWIEVLVFTIVYLPIRSYSGGYHASSNARCVIVSTLVILIVCFTTKFYRGYDTLLAESLALLVTGGIVFVFAPVEDSNKPLDEIEIKRYRWISRLFWLGQAIVWVICYQINPTISFVIAISQLLLSIMLLIGEIKNISC